LELDGRYIHPLQIEAEREEDGRLLASVPELPGVMGTGSHWRATKAGRVYAALLRIGWTLKKQVGQPDRCIPRCDFTFSFHDGEEVGPGSRQNRKRQRVEA
jgi:hypothetical protein